VFATPAPVNVGIGVGDVIPWSFKEAEQTEEEAELETNPDHEHDHAHDSEHEHEDHHDDEHHHHHDHPAQPKDDLPPAPEGNLGLTVTTSGLDEETKRFVQINNDLGFRMYRDLVSRNPRQNVVFSPISATSSLAMLFLGARGSTSWQLNKLLRLDEMITFNPHLLYKNISDSLAGGTDSAQSGSTKFLSIDQYRDELINFYKMRIEYFYNAKANQFDFDLLPQKVEELANTEIARQTGEAADGDVVGEDDLATLDFAPPLSILDVNKFKGIFEKEGDETTLQFINLPRGRRLHPVSAMSWSGEFKVGYQGDLDATVTEIPLKGGDLSIILILPGKLSEFVAGGLPRIEDNLTDQTWNQLLRTCVARSVDLEVPVFTAKSSLSLEATLQGLGIQQAFGAGADFSGINGVKDLKISSVAQINQLALGQASSRKRRNSRTSKMAGREWAATVEYIGREGTLREKSWKGDVQQIVNNKGREEGRRWKSNKKDRVLSYLNRTNRQSKTYQIHLDRQFLYIVRHNPTGLNLFIGRYFEPEDEE